jgi:hypothetical protein
LFPVLLFAFRFDESAKTVLFVSAPAAISRVTALYNGSVADHHPTRATAPP